MCISSPPAIKTKPAKKVSSPPKCRIPSSTKGKNVKTKADMLNGASDELNWQRRAEWAPPSENEDAVLPAKAVEERPLIRFDEKGAVKHNAILQAEAKEAKSRAGGLQFKASALQGHVDELKARIGLVEGENVALKARVGSLEKKNGLLEGDNIGLKARVGSLEEKTGSLEGDNIALKARVDELFKLIEARG